MIALLSLFSTITRASRDGDNHDNYLKPLDNSGRDQNFNFNAGEAMINDELVDQELQHELSPEEMESDLLKFEESSSASLDEFGPDDDSTAQTVDQELSVPEPSIRVRAKIMQIPVGSRGQLVDAVYCMVTAYVARFKYKHVTEPIRGATIQFRHQMPRSLYVYIETKGEFKRIRLRANQWYEFQAAQDGQLPFALESKSLSVLEFIRVRIRGMPDGFSWVLSPAMLLLKPLASMDAATFLDTKNNIRLIDSRHYGIKSADAIHTAVKHIAGPASFSQAQGILNARGDANLDGSQVPIRVSDYRKISRIAQEKKNAEGRLSNGDDVQQDFANADDQIRHLHKRAVDVSFMGHEYNSLKSQSATHREFLEDHHVATEHEHWELHFGDGPDGISFIPHTIDSAHERVAKLSKQSVEITVSDHKLFKRNFIVNAYEDMRDGILDKFSSVKETMDGNVKSVVVVSENDDLIVRFINSVGKVVSLVIATVQQGFQLVIEILRKVGIDLPKLVSWIRAVFNWNSMLRAITVSAHIVKTMPAYSYNMLQKGRETFLTKVQSMKNEIIGSLDAYIGRFTGQGDVQANRARLQNEMQDATTSDHGASFLTDMARRNMGSSSTTISCQRFPKQQGISEKATIESALVKIADKFQELFNREQRQEDVRAMIDRKSLRLGHIDTSIVNFLTGVRNMLEPFFDAADEANVILFDSLQVIIKDLDLTINCHVSVPHIDTVWRYVMKETQPLTLGVLLVLPGSSMMSAMYSMYNRGEEPFDNNDVRALITNPLNVREEPSPRSMLYNWISCTNCRQRSPATLEHIFSLVTGFNKIFMSMILAVVEPAQSFLPFKPFVHFVHHMMSFRVQSPESLEAGTYNEISQPTYIYGLVPLVFLQATSFSQDLAKVASQRLSKEITNEFMEMVIRVPQMTMAVYEFMTDLNSEHKLPQGKGMISSSARGVFMSWKAIERGLETMPQLPGPVKLLEYEINVRALASLVGMARINLALAMEWVY